METSNLKLKRLINNDYKYGFSTTIEIDCIKKGLSEEIIHLISKKKEEPLFMLEFRLRAFKKWKKMNEPKWSHLNYEPIDYQSIRYYSAPKKKAKLNSLDEVDPELLRAFQKLGISLTEQKKLSNIAVDAVFDSVSLGTTFKTELAKSGVIFCSISEAIKNYPDLVQLYLGSVVPIGDNFFTALNFRAQTRSRNGSGTAVVHIERMHRADHPIVSCDIVRIDGRIEALTQKG